MEGFAPSGAMFEADEVDLEPQEGSLQQFIASFPQFSANAGSHSQQNSIFNSLGSHLQQIQHNQISPQGPQAGNPPSQRVVMNRAVSLDNLDNPGNRNLGFLHPRTVQSLGLNEGNKLLRRTASPHPRLQPHSSVSSYSSPRESLSSTPDSPMSSRRSLTRGYSSQGESDSFGSDHQGDISEILRGINYLVSEMKSVSTHLTGLQTEVTELRGQVQVLERSRQMKDVVIEGVSEAEAAAAEMHFSKYVKQPRLRWKDYPLVQNWMGMEGGEQKVEDDGNTAIVVAPDMRPEDVVRIDVDSESDADAATDSRTKGKKKKREKTWQRGTVNSKPWIVDAKGNPVSGKQVGNMNNTAREIFDSLSCKFVLTSFSNFPPAAAEMYCDGMETFHEELRYCNNRWKVIKHGSDTFNSWKQSRRNTAKRAAEKLTKIEPKQEVADVLMDASLQLVDLSLPVPVHSKRARKLSTGTPVPDGPPKKRRSDASENGSGQSASSSNTLPPSHTDPTRQRNASAEQPSPLRVGTPALPAAPPCAPVQAVPSPEISPAPTSDSLYAPAVPRIPTPEAEVCHSMSNVDERNANDAPRALNRLDENANDIPALRPEPVRDSGAQESSLAAGNPPKEMVVPQYSDSRHDIQFLPNASRPVIAEPIAAPSKGTQNSQSPVVTANAQEDHGAASSDATGDSASSAPDAHVSPAPPISQAPPPIAANVAPPSSPKRKNNSKYETLLDVFSGKESFKRSIWTETLTKSEFNSLWAAEKKIDGKEKYWHNLSMEAKKLAKTKEKVIASPSDAPQLS
ncbi:hypothetical protein SISNIDRAFT_484364 [Sistotremastrum niveocremeum HHB9708]|uniref:Uncharacterized protein n=1 Tax=Sistotremastrum niveocremeum HHB9708 TaxID=1314777 RepID=A0A164W8K8_9AGAM|nr:hypothetical protein SISNIDRAFT_484364 [Sistotremastrum niveocremeum HHB9708]